MAPQAGKEKEDPLRALADKLRGKGGVEYRTAVLGDQRVEFMRGKDLAAYLQDHTDLMARFVSGGKKLEEQVGELVLLLARRQLLLRCDRMFKKPKPGKKRLARWPKKLVPVQEQVYQEDAFYAWLYERPSSPWMFAFSILAAVLVVAACLFPLAPYRVKLVVFYTSLSLIGVIVGSLLLRGLVAFATWVAIGRSLWLLPNLLAEDLGIDQAFWPLVALDEAADEPAGYNAAPRAGFAVAFMALCFMLYQHAPDKGRVNAGARKTMDHIYDFLNLHDPNQQTLPGAAAPQPPPQPNATQGAPDQAPEDPAPGEGADGKEGSEGDFRGDEEEEDGFGGVDLDRLVEEDAEEELS